MQWWNMFRSLTNSFYRNPGLPVNTSRLLLRDFVAADHASVHRYAVDPKVTQYTDRGPNREADTKGVPCARVGGATETPSETI